MSLVTLVPLKSRVYLPKHEDVNPESTVVDETGSHPDNYRRETRGDGDEDVGLLLFVLRICFPLIIGDVKTSHVRHTGIHNGNHSSRGKIALREDSQSLDVIRTWPGVNNILGTVRGVKD